MTVTEVPRTDEQVRQAVVAWLRASLPPTWVEAIDTGDAAELQRARALVGYDEWCARLGEAGWATPTWPREYGGAGLEPSQARIVNEELTRYKVPRSFDFVAELPRDPNGKLYKRTLRDPYWAGRERAI